ncbi:MAG: PrsW family intramembrane metalloprotease [Actinomycetota bacterium]|nr:PrsW family intramembrane metalloprotease [Actinomycetota bacterium]
MKILRRRWLQVLVGGLVLLYLVERTLLATRDLAFVPSVLLLGAFLVPVAFVVYLDERMPRWELPLTPVAICFIWGGVMGTSVAASLEYDLLRSLGLLPLLGVGLIEEGVKLIVPLIFYFLGRYRSERAGIVLGVSAAMGFAAFETMGYGFLALLQSGGNLVALDSVLIGRGLISPAGHAAWTGLVCAVLWRERLRVGRAVVNGKVMGAFAAAVVLHTLWDTFNLLRGVTFVGFLSLELLSFLVAIVSLTLLIRRIREANKEPYAETNVEHARTEQRATPVCAAKS